MSQPYDMEAYEYGWIIRKRVVKGENSKTPGAVSYVPHKYVSSLEQACTTLLELLIRDDARHSEIAAVNDLQRSVRKAMGIARKIGKQTERSIA